MLFYCIIPRLLSSSVRIKLLIKFTVICYAIRQVLSIVKGEILSMLILSASYK